VLNPISSKKLENNNMASSELDISILLKFFHFLKVTKKILIFLILFGYPQHSISISSKKDSSIFKKKLVYEVIRSISFPAITPTLETVF